MRRTITMLFTAAVLSLPVANTAAAAVKAKVVIRKFTGAAYQADRFGTLQVVITVKKTTVGKKVTRIRSTRDARSTSAKTRSRSSAAKRCAPRARTSTWSPAPRTRAMRLRARSSRQS